MADGQVEPPLAPELAHRARTGDQRAELAQARRTTVLPERGVLHAVQLEQGQRLRVVARGDLDLVSPLAQPPDDRPEHHGVCRRGHVDPDLHLLPEERVSVTRDALDAHDQQSGGEQHQGERHRAQGAVERPRQRRRTLDDVPSCSSCSPGTAVVRRRSSRTGALSRSLRHAQPEAACRHEHTRVRAPPRASSPTRRSRPGRRPMRRRTRSRCESGRRQLEVVPRPEETRRRRRTAPASARRSTRWQSRSRPRLPAHERECTRGAIGELGLQRMPVELVQSMSGRCRPRERRRQGRPQAIEMKRRCGGGAQRDIGEVPGGVRRMQQGDEVAPAAGAKGVEGGAIKRASEAVCGPRGQLSRPPHHDPATEAHHTASRTAAIPAASARGPRAAASG